jgi:hypothetical protein
MGQLMIRLVVFCVECDLGLVVARRDLDLDSNISIENSPHQRLIGDVPSNSFTSKSRPDDRSGVLARGQNQLITFVVISSVQSTSN